MPVFYVEPLGVNHKGHDANDASPRDCRGKFDGGEDKVGHHWLPDRLKMVFESSTYCDTIPFHGKTGPSGNETEEVEAGGEEMD